MGSARRVKAPLLIVMDLRIGFFILSIFFSSLATSLAALCTSSSPSISCSDNYSLPALKSLCLEYACSTWKLLLRPADNLSSQPSTRLITPGNVFVLLNLIILALLVNTHIQQPAAVQRSSSQKKRKLHQKQILLLDSAPPAERFVESPSLVGYGEAAASFGEGFPTSSGCTADLLLLPAASMESWKLEDLGVSGQIQYGGEVATTRAPAVEVPYEASIALEISIPGVAPMQENLITEDQESSAESSAAASHCATSSNVQQIILEEDGQLKLVEVEAIDDTAKIENTEDGEGSDAEKIVLQDDGQLRFIDRPLPVSGFTNKPLKSLSDTSYCPKDDNQETNHAISSLNYGTHSLNANRSSISEPINDYPNLDHGSNPALNHDAPPTCSSDQSSAAANKRPSRVKKADSLDTTWRAINQSKSNVINSNHRNKDSKHLIRQSSRQGFKPNTRGLVRDAHGNNSGSNKAGRSSSLVRREPSIGQEELNAKVESFIARFNEQIRIQRQESILSFMQMVDRGA